MFRIRKCRAICRVFADTFSVQQSQNPLGKCHYFHSRANKNYGIQGPTKTCNNNPEILRSRIASHLPNFYSTDVKKSILPNLVGQQQSQEDESKIDEEEKANQWKRTKLGFYFFGVSLTLAGSVLIYEFSRPDYDENGNVIEDQFSNLPFFEQKFKRLLNAANYYKKIVQEPSRDKLLPDPLKYPYIQPPYTVVLELKDVLVHPDWTYQTGWRFKKRPGVDQFLEALPFSQFELVIYTAEQGMTVFPIVDALDPQGHIAYRLVRDATRFINGHHVKDLDSLNRDLSKVIVIDWNDQSVQLHKENLLKIPRWNGNDDDLALLDLAAFLQTIFATKVEDVREVLSYYKQFDNPLEAFRENQRKLLMQMQEEQKMQAKQHHRSITPTTWRPSFLNR